MSAYHSLFLTKTTKWLTGVLLVTLLACGGLTIDFFRTQKGRPAVAPSALKNKTVLFYRDDCSECKKVFPRLWWYHLFHQDLVFVNVNNKTNRHYIQRYELVEVPTLAYKGENYTGTNPQNIQEILTRKKKLE